MKICTQCKEHKSIDSFHIDRRSKDGLNYLCKICVNSKNAVYRKSNPHKRRESVAKWTRSNLKLDRESKRKWKKANPGLSNSYTAKRHAAKMQRTPKWLTDVHFEQMQIFYRAAKDLTKEIGVKFEVDHIVPLQGETVSGLHVPWNLQVIPLSQNRAKKNYTDL